MSSPDGRYKRLPILLGRGSSKKVFKALDSEDGKEVAWNVIDIEENDGKRLEIEKNAIEEINILKSVKHPYIITFYECFVIGRQFVFITELISSGTLRDYISQMKRINIKVIKRWSLQILKALEYLHDNKIIHRDIKSENVFVDGTNGIVKIGDLGVSRRIRGGVVRGPGRLPLATGECGVNHDVAKRSDDRCYTLIGTPQFMSREIFQGSGYSSKVDVYAFGMVLLEMSTGMLPYSNMSTSDIIQNVINGNFPEELGRVKQRCLKVLIDKCLADEPNRIDVKGCIVDHFYTDGCNGNCGSNVEAENLTTSTMGNTDLKNTASNTRRTGFKKFVRMKRGPAGIIRAQITLNNRIVTFKYVDTRDTPQIIVNELVAEKLIEESEAKDIKNDIVEGLKVLEFKEGVVRSPVISGGSRMVSPTRSFDGTHDIPKTTSSDKSPGASPADTQFSPSDKPIIKFLIETAQMIGRDDLICEWDTKLKSSGVETTGDLKILTDNDWDELPLTVLSSRAMRTCMYEKGYSATHSADRFYFGDSATVEELVQCLRCELREDTLRKLRNEGLTSCREIRMLEDSDWKRIQLSVVVKRVLRNAVGSPQLKQIDGYSGRSD